MAPEAPAPALSTFFLLLLVLLGWTSMHGMARAHGDSSLAPDERAICAQDGGTRVASRFCSHADPRALTPTLLHDQKTDESAPACDEAPEPEDPEDPAGPDALAGVSFASHPIPTYAPDRQTWHLAALAYTARSWDRSSFPRGPPVTLRMRGLATQSAG